MVELRTKLYLVASIPAALTVSAFYLSATVDGPDATFLYRLGLTLAIAGFVFCMITWDAHRINLLQADQAFQCVRADAAERRADNAEDRYAALEERIKKLEADKQCLTMIREAWTPEDDDRLQALFRPEEN